MTTPRDIVLAFDLYGTLLSTTSIAEKLAEHFGQERGGSLAATWRRYQLEYTWRLNSMGLYEPFSVVTMRSLRHTLTESGLSFSEDAVIDLMRAYDSLATFPDVKPALTKLASIPNIAAVIFSNGTQAMVQDSISKSSDLVPFSNVFSDVMVVGEVECFKPDPKVYRMLARKLGRSEADMSTIWLVSGNAFDIVGAKAVGMQAVWVDRTGLGWTDSLVQGGNGRPTAVVKSLEEVLDIVQKRTGSWTSTNIVSES